jgi:hypothetical protein
MRRDWKKRIFAPKWRRWIERNMPLFPPENAIGWAQFALRGGWRKTIPLLIGYITVIAVAIMLSIQFNPKYKGDVCYGWTTALLAIQSAMLVLYGCSRLTAGIRQDTASRLMESHRLMPTPPAHAVTGYIVGGISQAVLLGIVTFLIGTFTSAGASINFERWAMANLIVFIFAIFLWCIAIFAGFLPKGAGGIIWFIVSIPIFGQGGAMGVLPGLTVLISPLIGPSIFELRATTSVPWTYAAALTAQGFFGGICFIGACRKYQRADAPGLGVILGLALVLGWAGVSWAGIRQWDEFRPGWLRMHLDVNVQISASILAGLLIAIAPISAAAMETIRWRRHVALHDPAPLSRPVPWPIVILLATLLIVAFSYAPHTRPLRQNEAALRTAIVIVLSLSAIYLLCRWCYRAISTARLAIGLWIFLAWILPIVIDGLRYAFSTNQDAEPLSWISGCGPIGALILIWNDEMKKANAGIVMQVCIALVPPALDWMTRPRRSLPLPPLAAPVQAA